MLSREAKRGLQSTLFRHLDGIVAAPTAYSLYKKGVLDFLLEHKDVQLDELSETFKANAGYMNVALRVLSSQGWLRQDIDNARDTIHFSLTEKSKVAFEHVHLYADVVHLLKFSEAYHPRKFEIEPYKVLDKIFDKYRNRYNLPSAPDQSAVDVREQILKHIEGILVGPTVVLLGMHGMFHKYFMEASFKPDEYHNDTESFTRILNFFTYLGWYTEKNATYQFTEKGLYFAKRATAYGVTVSYIPTLRKLDELIFGDPGILRNQAPGSAELHVDREMNVWGSGGAHSSYFKVIDEIIIEMFNRPILEQPRGILDMGCGNGALLEHLFNVIEYHTLRGKMLDEHPLFLVGADYNETALRVTRSNLISADIWAKIIWGDVGQPVQLAEDLKEDYSINIQDLLNVRTFLDHNRIWSEPKLVNVDRLSTSTGAFAHRGKRINNNLIEDALLEHFNKWEPFIRKFGLIVIELHTISPDLAARNIGRTPATAYDATHGYSDQYIVEIDVLKKVAAEAGLVSDPGYFRKFPDSDLATVTVNLLRGRD
jgi:DNA-binding MarR family transcriptional regulator